MDRIDLTCLADSPWLAARLAAAGLSAAAVEAKVGLFAHCAEALRDAGVAPDAPARALFVPGRIEVLGKHTDYAGGSSLVAAPERGVCLVAADRDDAAVRAFALDLALQRHAVRGGLEHPPRKNDIPGPRAVGPETHRARRLCGAVGLGDTAEFAVAENLVPTAGHWSNYPMTTARRLARNFGGDLRGADVAFSSDLPVAAGMSSSSSLMVAFYLALAAVNRLDRRAAYRENITSPESLAAYLGAVENGQTFGSLVGDKGVGTFGGSEDHTAMLCCRPGTLSQYAYCPTRPERTIPLPAGYTFAIASSGIAAEKTGEAMAPYNRSSHLASAVAAAWRDATGRDDATIADALASSDPDEAAERMRAILAQLPAGSPFSAEELAARFEHFRAENVEILPAAGDALAAGDLAEFRRQVDRSQRLAETLLGNQVPQTVCLARSARESGAAAASAFGAGFGGSVWAMVREDEAEAFLENWAARYALAHTAEAAEASFFRTRPGPAAFNLAKGADS